MRRLPRCIVTVVILRLLFALLILRLEDYVLLAEALPDFVTLTATMFTTLRVDWTVRRMGKGAKRPAHRRPSAMMILNGGHASLCHHSALRKLAGGGSRKAEDETMVSSARMLYETASCLSTSHGDKLSPPLWPLRKIPDFSTSYFNGLAMAMVKDHAVPYFGCRGHHGLSPKRPKVCHQKSRMTANDQPIVAVSTRSRRRCVLLICRRYLRLRDKVNGQIGILTWASPFVPSSYYWRLQCFLADVLAWAVEWRAAAPRPAMAAALAAAT